MFYVLLFFCLYNWVSHFVSVCSVHLPGNLWYTNHMSVCFQLIRPMKRVLVRHHIRSLIYYNSIYLHIGISVHYSVYRVNIEGRVWDETRDNLTRNQGPYITRNITLDA
jgi:hypothetical protein